MARSPAAPGSATLPFLYGASLITTTPGEVSLNVRLKTASELGLNASEASILNAVIGAADSDAPVAGAFLGVADSETLRASLQQMLPEHAGGAFENVTKGSRPIGGIPADPHPPGASEGGRGLGAPPGAVGPRKSIGWASFSDIVGRGGGLG